MPDDPRYGRLTKDPWITALFAGLAGLFVYAIWFAPHDRNGDAQNQTTSAPVPENR
jgi:hypothetical protein